MSDFKPDDLIISTHRMPGSGSWALNGREFVQIYHKPTDITVCCSGERSQHQNRAKAMDMLKDKIKALNLPTQLELDI